MPLVNSPELSFEVNLLFKEEKNAIEAFNQMLRFYEVLSDFDKMLTRNISPNILSEYALIDVEYSSLRTKLVQVIKKIPDEWLSELEIRKIIGYFLVKLKYKLIKLLSDEKEINSKEQVQHLTDEVNGEIKTFGDKYTIIVTQVNNYFILNAIDDLTQEVNNLNENELLEYKSQAGNIFIQRGVFLNKPKILSELGQRKIVNETKELLKLKKVDLLSDESKWDFLQGKRLIKAKVLDKKWLDSFHHRKVTIKPEDALMVTLRTTHTYNPNFDDKKTECEIVKVHSVISPDSDNIQEFNFDNQS